eukprot:1161925-Pelagomonas_calceolata.AAC.8
MQWLMNTQGLQKGQLCPIQPGWKSKVDAVDLQHTTTMGGRTCPQDVWAWLVMLHDSCIMPALTPLPMRQHVCCTEDDFLAVYTDAFVVSPQRTLMILKLQLCLYAPTK